MEKVLYIKTICKDDIWVDFISNWKTTHNWIPSVIVGENKKNESFIRGKFENIDFYNHQEALLGVRPDFLSTQYVFSEKELNLISDYENVFIAMIDRWSINSGKVDYFTLRNYFINMVGVWLGILNNKNITVIILPSIPHRLYDYACYVASKMLNIPYLGIERTGEIRLKNNKYILSGFVVDDIFDRTKSLYKKYLKEKVVVSDSDFELITHMQGDYSNTMPNYFLENELKSIKQTTLYSSVYGIFIIIKKSFKFLVLGFKKSQSIFKFTQKSKVTSLPRIALKVEVFIVGVVNKIRVKKAIEFYNNNLSEPNYEDTYVYIAPHFRPERSTVPDAGYFHDLEMIIDLISKNIPSHWKIYYKEHKGSTRKPISWNNILTTECYKRILNKYPHLSFIDINNNPFELIDNAVFVATATGLTGWESITRGKPAVIFGDAWYRNSPGVFYIKSNQDIEDAINKIKKGVEISKKEIAGYAKFLLANSSEVTEYAKYIDVGYLKNNNNLEYLNVVNEYCLQFVKKLESISLNE
jgi:hypothetical protein